MAARAPPYTVNLDIPVLGELIQSNRDLSREVSALRTQLSARLDAIEARLTTRDLNRSPSNVPSQNLNHDASLVDEDHTMDNSRHVDQDLDVQDNNPANQDSHDRDDHEDALVQDYDLTHEHHSSPSVDEGIAVVNPASPLPVHGKKRKRTAKCAATQRRHEESGRSRSESPFDSDNEIQESSDRLDIIPPIRPQPKARASQLKNRPQRSKTVMDDTDETATPVSQEITLSQYGKPRKQARPPPGFVGTPTPDELAKMLRQNKKKK